MELSYIKEILKGDVSRFTYFVEEYKQMAYSIAFRIVNNNEDAEEVVQDSFLKAYKALKTFKGNSKFSTWFYRIVVNAALTKSKYKSLKSEATDIEEVSDSLIETVESTYKGYSVAEQRRLVNIALERLSAEDSLLLTLYYLNESTVAEVSEITMIPPENIKMKLSRGRKKMFFVLSKLMSGN